MEDRILNIIRKIDFCVKESISKNLPIVKGPMLDHVAPVGGRAGQRPAWADNDGNQE